MKSRFLTVSLLAVSRFLNYSGSMELFHNAALSQCNFIDPSWYQSWFMNFLPFPFIPAFMSQLSNLIVVDTSAAYFLFWSDSMRRLTAQPPGCLGTNGWVLNSSAQAGMTSEGVDGHSSTSFLTKGNVSWNMGCILTFYCSSPAF